MSKINWKKAIEISVAILGTAFVGATILAKNMKADSQYNNDPEQKNPFEGKRVFFVEDENDKENADGVKGHLEAIGDTEYCSGFYEKYIKRGIDIALSFGGLVVLSPILVAISLAIVIDDPGPVLFTQKRVGQNKKYFKLHKFRSMKMSTPHDVPTHMLENPEQYITKVGKFLRAHSLDELPQIWDIFIGNMSVIGPRPGLWNQDLLTAERDKYNANDVKPGLTGWAQINGRDELEIPDKARLDGEYVEKMGFAMDIKCFLGSVHVFGKDESVVEGGTGEMKKAVNTVCRHYTDGKNDEELIGHIGFGGPVEVDRNGHKKILITGAGSYIGETFEAYASEHYPENFSIDTLDMLDVNWKEADFSAYDVVYHVAGIAHADVGKVSDKVKEKYYSVNTDLATEVAQKAKEAGVKEFIFMSSMIVYGESAPYGKKKVVDEHTVPSPDNFYGDSKLQADVGVRELADENFKVIVLRSPMIYGRGSKGNYPILAKLAKVLPIFPDVDNERSMLYIGNLCEFLCQVMLVKELRSNSVVLIPQNAEWTKTVEMVQEIATVSGKKVRELRIINPVVLLVSKMPGKIGGLVNKAFGSYVYMQSLSQYNGIDYAVYNLHESIDISERNLHVKKKRIAIVSSQYFWLPEEAGPSRFYSIARMFKDNDYEVDVYTSSYEHHEKKQRDKTIPTDLNIIYIDCLSYKRNVDPKRELSNIMFSKKIVKLLEERISDYSAVYCSIPPNNIGKEVGSICKRNNVPFVVDIEDLWPEAMTTIFNKAAQVLTRPYLHDAEKTYSYADGVVGTSEEYTARAWKNNNRTIPNRTVYVGTEISAFDEEVVYYVSDIVKSEDEFWVIYTGSIGHSYAIDNIVKAAKRIKNNKIKFKILGDGPLRAECEELAMKLQCDNIEFLGYVSHPLMAAYLVKSDITINSFAKGVAQSIVNKVGDYLAAGKPMINTLENSECCRLISNNNIGVNISAENPEELVEAIEMLYLQKEKCDEMGANARKLAENKFDRKTSYKEIVELVSSLEKAYE